MTQIDGAMMNSRAVRVSDVFKVAEELVKDPHEVVINFRYGMNSHRAYAEEVTLVLSRELRTTAEISCAVAMRLALRFPEKNVLVFNTFAGADLLTEGFVRALRVLGLKIPYTLQTYIPEATLADLDESADLPSPNNLHIVDAPTSTLTPAMLREEIDRNRPKFIILNSLDFAAFTDRRRKELAEAILDVRHRLGITVFVFSHDLRAMVPYTAGRGALGLLCAFSKSVWHLLEDWEQRAWTKPLNQYLIQETTNLELMEKRIERAKAKAEQKAKEAAEKGTVVEAIMKPEPELETAEV